MGCLNTADGSREVSPVPAYVFSHDSSPSALFNSPSPTAQPNFASGGGHAFDMDGGYHGLPAAPVMAQAQPPPYSMPMAAANGGFAVFERYVIQCVCFLLQSCRMNQEQRRWEQGQWRGPVEREGWGPRRRERRGQAQCQGRGQQRGQRQGRGQ